MELTNHAPSGKGNLAGFLSQRSRRSLDQMSSVPPAVWAKPGQHLAYNSTRAGQATLPPQRYRVLFTRIIELRLLGNSVGKRSSLADR